MNYERAYALAGNICHKFGCDREPSAWTKQSQVSHSSTPAARGSRGGGAGGGWGGRGGGSGAQKGTRREIPRNLPDGTITCGFFQSGSCFSQGNFNCVRDGTTYKHVCSFQKSGGVICQMNHTKANHDPAKHGN